MNIQIPINEEFQSDFRKILTSIAQSVIEEVKVKEMEFPDYLTVKETEKYLRCSFVSLQKYERMGLKHIRLEGKKLFNKKTIQVFLAEHEQL